MFLVGWGLVLGFPLEKRTEKIKPQICVHCIFVTKICAVCIFEEKILTRLIIRYVHLRQKSIQSVSLRPKYVFAVSISAVTFFPVSAHSSASPSSFPPNNKHQKYQTRTWTKSITQVNLDSLYNLSILLGWYGGRFVKEMYLLSNLLIFIPKSLASYLLSIYL